MGWGKATPKSLLTTTLDEAQPLNALLKVAEMAPSGFPSVLVLSQRPVAFICSFIHSFIPKPHLGVYRALGMGNSTVLQPCFQKVYLEENLSFVLWFRQPPWVAKELELSGCSCSGLSPLLASTPKSLNRSRKVTNCGCKLALVLILAYSKTLNIFPN